jgi:site-specific DNA-adenine methylase
MKTPLVNQPHTHNIKQLLKQKIPPSSVVESFRFLDGDVEIDLAAHNRFVIAHTTQYVVYEFWKCVSGDPHRVTEIAEMMYPLDPDEYHSKRMFHLLQENWHTYKDPFIRSALFFILNRCSSTGEISAGEFEDKNLTSIAFGRVKAFNAANLHFKWDQTEEHFADCLASADQNSILFIPAGKFSLNLFEHGKSLGFEMTGVNHKKLHAKLQSLPHKWIVAYKPHKTILNLYEKYNIQLVDKYGRETSDLERCEDLLIANF